MSFTFFRLCDIICVIIDVVLRHVRKYNTLKFGGSILETYYFGLQRAHRGKIS